jgi:hypothetical protein
MEDQNNKLDRFLRRHLNDTSEDQNWNVPDDAIFEKAMQAVANEKKKKRKTWLLIPLLLLSGLMANEYMHNRQIKILEGKINHLEDSLSIASQNEDGITSSLENHQKSDLSSSTTSSRGNQVVQVNTSGDTIAFSAEANPEIAIPTSSSIDAGGATSRVPTSQHTQSKRKSTPLEPNRSAFQIQNLPATIPASTTSISTPSVPETTLTVDHSGNHVGHLIGNESLYAGDASHTSISGIRTADQWMTAPIPSLDVKGVSSKANLPPAISVITDNVLDLAKSSTPSKPVFRYGVLGGINQSWMTMKNIPLNQDAYLHDYDNSQTGTSFYGFVNKSISAKFSAQGGLGYHAYLNRSALESRFLFDTDNVVQVPDGDPLYQTDIDLMNPIGDFNAPLEFRVTDQMNEEDVMTEHTTIEQTLQSVRLDLQLQGTMLTINNFTVSLGTGLGLAYRSGLKNTFNVSTYHNNILQKTQTEAPDHLTNVRRWYVQWLGSLNLEYTITDRFGFIFSSQYARGLTSIRNTPNTNGPLTFVHAFSISAGLTRTF